METNILCKTFPVNHTLFYNEFEKWRKELPKETPKGGVYLLRINRSIGRLLKEDETGLLYIGEGILFSVNNRLGKLINAINNTESRHDAGNRMANLLNKKFEIKNLKVEVIMCKNHKELEADKLTEYYDIYGELPPLNRKMEYNN